MAPEDAKKTAFRTPKGNFYNKVMPFGLKNAGSTYQRAMTTIFQDMMHKEIEDYVDDIVVKSGKGENHIAVLDRVFERCRANKMKMNPLKCSFGVSAGTFLGFVFHRNGIEVDPSKIKAILEMPPPITLKQLKSLMGKISYIRWFIPNLSKKVKTWSVIMKKGFEFVWSEECQKAETFFSGTYRGGLDRSALKARSS